MQVSVESREGLERCMTVELPAERVDAEVEKRLKRIAGTSRIDGFRPGKAPLSVIRRRYGGQVRNEVFGELIQSSYFEALSQENLRPAGDPKIEPLEKAPGEGVGYSAVFEVMPEVALVDMSGATVKRPVVEITDEDVDNMIEKLRKQRMSWNEVERGAQEGDQLTLSFEGFMGGETFEGGSAKEVPLVLGSGRMIEGFEAGLEGMAVNEKRTLELKFPEDYGVEHLAGKPVTFEVEAVRVSEPVLPELDAAFAKAFGVEDGDLESLRKDIRANMERELERKTREMVKGQAMQALSETHEIEVPASLIDAEADRLMERAKSELAQYGRKGNIDNLSREIFLEEAKKRVVLGLIVAEVVKQKEIKVDGEQVRARVEELAADYDKPEEVIEWYYGNREQLEMIENVVLEEQVVDWVLGEVKVEDDVTTFDALVEENA